MSFYARPSGKSGWILTKQTYENGKKSQKTVPKEAYQSLGFNKLWSIEQARARVQQVNAQDNHEKLANIRAARQYKELELIDAIYLPKDITQQFQSWLIDNFDLKDRRYKKILSHWHRVQHLIIKTQVHPHQYFANRGKIYQYFLKQKYSLDYTKKIIRILNLFGEFVSEHTTQFFKPIPKMSQSEANRIRDTYTESERYIGPSGIMTPTLLEKIKNQLKVEQYRWLYISVWFGLRPKEIEMLNDKKRGHQIEEKKINGKKIKVLSVFQTKLASVAAEQRWKYIPIIPEIKELEIALGYINQDIQKPLNKTLKHLTGKQITCYGGRKGFTSLMLNHGQKLEDISSWLGHNSIETTWKKYRDRDRVNFSEVKKSA